jgi:hypothetical protein
MGSRLRYVTGLSVCQPEAKKVEGNPVLHNQSNELSVIRTGSSTQSQSMQDSPDFASAVAIPSPTGDEFKELMAMLAKMSQNITSSTEQPKYLTVQDAAAYCRVAVQTIYNNRKHIARMPGLRKLLFTRESLDEWLATRPSARRKRK